MDRVLDPGINMKSVTYVVVTCLCFGSFAAVQSAQTPEVSETVELNPGKSMLEDAARNKNYDLLRAALLHSQEHYRALAAWVIKDLPIKVQAPMWREWLLSERVWKEVGDFVSVNHSATQVAMLKGIGPALGLEVTQVPLTSTERSALAQRISTEILR